jgi:hypothetical protein
MSISQVRILTYLHQPTTSVSYCEMEMGESVLSDASLIYMQWPSRLLRLACKPHPFDIGNMLKLELSQH